MSRRSPEAVAKDAIAADGHKHDSEPEVQECSRCIAIVARVVRAERQAERRRVLRAFAKPHEQPCQCYACTLVDVGRDKLRTWDRKERP